MTPSLVGLMSLGGVLALIILRVPIAVALFVVTGIGTYALVGLAPALSILSTVPYNFASSWTLSTVPMFLLMGYVAFHSGLTRGLFEAARLWLGWLPGGLAIASIFGAGGFASVTGSSVACSAAIGRIAVPEMLARGYDIRVATGSVAAGGTIGALIPPSLLLILFGIYAQVSITQLFAWGAVVGLASIVMYCLAILVLFFVAPDRLPRAETFTLKERLLVLRKIGPTLTLVLLVFGGLFAGYFTATEAGAIGALFATIIGFAAGGLTRAKFVESCVDTLMSCGGLFIIAIAANAFTRLVALTDLSQVIGFWFTDMGFSTTGLLIAISAIYLILGMFLDPLGAMLLTLPIYLPLLTDHGVDFIWFGILLAKLLEMGMITPPVGLNVFVIHGIFKNSVRLEQIFAGIVPFFIADLVLIAGMLAMRHFIAL